MDHEAHGLVVDTCRRHGDKDVTLWQQALSYFAQRRDADCRQHITQVLSHILCMSDRRPSRNRLALQQATDITQKFLNSCFN